LPFPSFLSSSPEKRIFNLLLFPSPEAAPLSNCSRSLRIFFFFSQFSCPSFPFFPNSPPSFWPCYNTNSAGLFSFASISRQTPVILSFFPRCSPPSPSYEDRPDSFLFPPTKPALPPLLPKICMSFDSLSPPPANSPPPQSLLVSSPRRVDFFFLPSPPSFDKTWLASPS